jgi:hypothetical protein
MVNNSPCHYEVKIKEECARAASLYLACLINEENITQKTLKLNFR